MGLPTNFAPFPKTFADSVKRARKVLEPGNGEAASTLISRPAAILIVSRPAFVLDWLIAQDSDPISAVVP